MIKHVFSCGLARLPLILPAVFCLVAFTANDASAQRRIQRQYQPASPTVTPYLNLLQSNFGPIPNYYSMVRPRLQQQAFNRQVAASQRAQSLTIQAISEEQAEETPVSRTGKAAGFLNYLHYFPPPPTRQVRR